jgi:hypothetical protein
MLTAELQSTNDAVASAILSVMLAGKINDYYNQHFWQARDRKETDVKEN